MQIDEDDKIGGDEEGGWDVEENLDIPDIPDEAAGSEGKVIFNRKNRIIFTTLQALFFGNVLHLL